VKGEDGVDQLLGIPGGTSSSPRMLGLVSGLDIEGMLQKLVRSSEEPLRNLERQKIRLAWQQEAVQDVNRLFYGLYRAIEPLRLQGSYQTQRIDVSRPEVLRAESLGNTAPYLEITVDRLASPAALIGEPVLANGALVTWNTSLADLGWTSGVTWTIEISGSTFHTESLDIFPDDTLADLEAKLRATGLVAHYDESTGRFSLATTETGEDTSFVIKEASGDPSSFLERMGFSPTQDPQSGEMFVRATGQDASVVVGTSTISSPKNALEILGYRVTLLQPSGTAPVSIRSSLDVDAVVERVRGFVDAYNKLLSEVQVRLNEPKFRNAQPVLPEEAKELGESLAAERNAMAKSGLLARDLLLETLLSKLRTRLGEQRVGSSFALTSLSQVGITTESWQEKGILHFDEAAFREAFSRDAEGVSRLFAGYTETLSDGSKIPHAGLLADLYKDTYEAMRVLSRRAGGGFGLFFEPQGGELGRALLDLEGRIQVKTREVQALEERYVRQFTLLEQAVARANAQSAWLTSLFSGMNV